MEVAQNDGALYNVRFFQFCIVALKTIAGLYAAEQAIKSFLCLFKILFYSSNEANFYNNNSKRGKRHGSCSDESQTIVCAVRIITQD